MIGVVVVSHNNIAAEMIKSAEQMIGKQNGLYAVSVDINAETDDIRRAILSAITSAESGDGVIILADMYGGIPYNLALSVVDQNLYPLVSGVNLAMLVRLLSVRDNLPVDAIIQEAKDAAVKYI